MPHEMYAVLKDPDGAESKRRVLMYALCDDGQVYPLFFDSSLGVSSISEAADKTVRYELVWQNSSTMQT